MAVSNQLALTLGNLGDLRGVNHPDHGDMFSVTNFINIVNEKKANDSYGRTTWCRLCTGEFVAEVATKCVDLIIPGSFGKPTPCTNILGLQTILTHLPGKIAAAYRREINDTFAKVLAGDRSLIKIIEANSENSDPVNKLMREALKRKKEAEGEHDSENEEMDRALRRDKIREEIQQMRAQTSQLYLQNAQTWKTLYESVIPKGEEMDERARLMFKDIIMNCSLTTGNSKAITSEDLDSKPITISTCLTEKGLKKSAADIQKIGRIMARLYREKYSKDPDKHEQFVDGATRLINSYQRKHLDLLDKAVELQEKGVRS